MLSMPPATITSCSPARISTSASVAARMPDAHTLLIVSDPTVGPRPIPTETWREGICPDPACSTWPMIT